MISKPSQQLSTYLSAFAGEKSAPLRSAQAAHEDGAKDFEAASSERAPVLRQPIAPRARGRIGAGATNVVTLDDASELMAVGNKRWYPPPLKPLFGTYLGEDGNLYTDLRIGMPLMGRCNLAESPLLKEAGHLRWQHIEALTGVPSSELADEEGDRLYATFFYVEIAFSPQRPMATFAENDEVTIVIEPPIII